MFVGVTCVWVGVRFLIGQGQVFFLGVVGGVFMCGFLYEIGYWLGVGGWFIWRWVFICGWFLGLVTSGFGCRLG